VEEDSLDGSVGVATKLQRGRLNNRGSLDSQEFPSLQSVRHGSGSHQDISFSVNEEVIALEA